MTALWASSGLRLEFGLSFPAFVGDAVVQSDLQGQPGAASALRPGAQPGKLSAPIGATEVRETLVADDAPGEADQDRS